MKVILRAAFFILIPGYLFGQQASPPDWYKPELERQVGIWYADNSEYQSEEEIVDTYAIEWKMGPLGNEIFGRLYGLKDGKEIGVYWSFHQYWNPQNSEVILMQIGWDGTLGVGAVLLTKNMHEAVQVFTRPDGSSYKVGHRTEIVDANTEIGASFDIDSTSVWTKRRIYTWRKQ